MTTYTWNKGAAGTWNVGDTWTTIGGWDQGGPFVASSDSITLNTANALHLTTATSSATLANITVSSGWLLLGPATGNAYSKLTGTTIDLTTTGSIEISPASSGTTFNTLSGYLRTATGSGSITIDASATGAQSGKLNIYGGSDVEVKVYNSGTWAISTGTFKIGQGLANTGSGTGQDTWGGGSATFDLASSITNQNFTFNSQFLGTLTFDTGYVWDATDAVTGFDRGDYIKFNTTTISRVDKNSADDYTVSLQNGTKVELKTTNAAGTAIGSGSSLVGSNQIYFATCFAEGTGIATPAGNVAVETLSIGDMVVNQAGEARAIKWIGHRRLDFAAHPRPEMVAPVRILRGAFAETVPHRDLRVSPDHAILVDGKLICARQLINGSTIYQEGGCRSVTYFHIELDSHDILLADGLTAESYLNTGNDGFFTNADAPVTLHPDLTATADYPQRETDSVAPFVWDEATVQPIWQGLADRAAALGLSPAAAARTTDPDLQILLKGERISPLHSADGVFVFMVPAGTTAVQLCSRASRPSDDKPWLEDRRQLGLYMERIVLKEADSSVLEIPLDHPGLGQGWWAPEREGKTMRRWTNGEALLPLPESDDARILEIRASSSGMNYVLVREDICRAA
nr:Hint domain-containing protein [uncultured Rhodopila sp.]